MERDDFLAFVMIEQNNGLFYYLFEIASVSPIVGLILKVLIRMMKSTIHHLEVPTFIIQM